jgi:hypothetical protein
VAFQLKYTPEAGAQLSELQRSRDARKRYLAVKKALRFLNEHPRHPSLHTHKYQSMVGPGGAEVFEAYAEQNTPAVYRIFWCYYPPNADTITVLAITPHP